MAQKKFIIDGGFQTNADSVIAGNLNMTGSVIPSVDSDGTTGYDLGSPTAKWRDLYLSQGSLYIDGQKVLEANSGTILVQADADQGMTVKTSGSGVLTLQSATTLNVAATMQIAAGKNITSSDGSPISFTDGINLNGNLITNIGTPVDGTGVANKTYVDDAIDTALAGFAQNAITQNDTNVTISDAGTGTVTFNVDGSSVMTATSTTVDVDALTIAGSAAATQAYADQAEASAISSAKTYTDGRETVLQGNIDAEETARIAAVTAEATARASGDAATLASANAYTDTQVSNVIGAAPGALDTLNELAAALGNDADFAATTAASVATALSDAKAYTDAREVAITAAYDAYADQAELDAIATAKTYTDDRELVITSAYQAYADTAEADAISTANLAAQGYADSAKADAISFATSAVTTEVTDRITAVTAEATTRASADTTLQGNIDAVVADLADEVTRATAAEGVNATAIAAETTRATAAEAVLDSHIMAVESSVGLDAGGAYTAPVGNFLDTTTSVVNALVTLDTELGNEGLARISGDSATLASANSYTDGEIATLASSISSVSADVTALTTDDVAEGAVNLYYTDARAVTANASAIATAKSEAIAAAGDYTDARETAITTAYSSVIATAQTQAIDTAAGDATTKANAAVNTANAYTDGEILALMGALSNDISAADGAVLSSAQTYTDNAISSLLSGAGGALDTLNELSAALGDDPNFATNISNLIATKVAIGSAEYIKGATVSNDTITFTRGDNTTFSVTTSDANSDNYLTGLTFGTGDGILTAARTNGNVTVDLDGRYLLASANAVSASKWATARSITLAGDASGSVSLDGSANVTLTVTVANNSHTHTTANITGLDAIIANYESRIAALEAKLALVTSVTGGIRVAGTISATGDITAYGA
jgi:hypothetical protein